MNKLLSGIIAILAVTALVSCGENKTAAEDAEAYSEDTVIVSDDSTASVTGDSSETVDITDAEPEAADGIVAFDLQNEDEAAVNTDEPEAKEEQISEENDAYSRSYGILKSFIEANGEDDGEGKVVTYAVDKETTLFFELYNDGQMLWTAYFAEEDMTSVLRVFVDDELHTEHNVEMLAQMADGDEAYVWKGILDTSTLNYSDFNTVKLEIVEASSDMFAKEDVLPAMTINTQITVLCADIAMDSLELDLSVVDFGFPPTV